MGVDIGTYRARIGGFVWRKRKNEKKEKSGVEVSVIWFIMLIIAAMLVIAGVEVNPGPVELEDLRIMLNDMKNDMKNDTKTQNEIIFKKNNSNFEELKAQNERMHGEWMDLKREMEDIRKEMKKRKRVEWR